MPLPSAPSVPLAPNVSLQPPLSRRGHGPGIIIIDPDYKLPDLPSALPPSETIDPPPQYKWAEEGFAVVRVSIRMDAGPGGWDVQSALGKATEALGILEECDIKDRFALLVYGTPQQYPSSFPEQLTLSLADTDSIIGCVSFSAAWQFSTTGKPQLVHHPGPAQKLPDKSGTQTYAYPAMLSSDFIVPGCRDFSYSAASVAHTRSLTFIKKHLGGPVFDLEKIWDEHTYYEFEDRSVEKTMETMVLEPYVNHIPTMTGGIGRERLANFYRHHFIFSNPDDTALELVSRTVGVDRVVDEFEFSLRHTKQVDWLLPGIPPTNLPLRIPFVAVVNIRGDRLYHEHISWDQATVLRQLGLLPEYLPFPHPVPGREPGVALEYRVPAGGAETAAKLRDQKSVESNMLFVGPGEGVREVKHGERNEED